MGNRVLDLLEAADWNDILYKLTSHAIWRARLYKWKSGAATQLPGGKTPEDIACDAIEKVWSGIRNWDPDKYPNLLKHLMWIVDSDMEHLVCSMEHHKTRRLPGAKEGEETGPTYGEIIPDPSSPIQISGMIPTPEEELLAHEGEIFEQKLITELYAAVKGNEDLEFLLYCFELGIDKPAEIAAQMKWDVSKVYTLKRKLIRKGAAIKDAFLKAAHNDAREE